VTVVRKLMTYPKILAVTVLVIGLSLEATANSFTTFSFSNGTFAANSSLTTITLSPASVLTTVTGGPCSPACSGANLGSVTFTTAALMSGSLAAGGTFAPGGMLTVTGNGMHGVPSGILFQGTFTTGTWVVTSIPHVGNLFTFVGTFIGTGAFSGTGSTSQSSFLVSGNPFAPGGSGRVASPGGHATVGVIPEPGTLALIGTGMLGIGTVIRRKLLKA